jgi:hypothetical protein
MVLKLKDVARSAGRLEPGSTMRRLILVSAAVIVVISVRVLAAQEPAPARNPKPSQHGTVSQRIADTTITIEYNRPVARGRELFGKLVPWGRIWCPCADDATTVATTTDIQINGESLAAGTYSMWTEPQQSDWTLIFNREHAAWHTRYPAGKDALRIKATPRTGAHMETLAFYFPVVEGRTAELVLHWGTMIVPMKIDVP